MAISNATTEKDRKAVGLKKWQIAQHTLIQLYHNKGCCYHPHCSMKWQLTDLSFVPPDQKQPLSWKKNIQN